MGLNAPAKRRGSFLQVSFSGADSSDLVSVVDTYFFGSYLRKTLRSYPQGGIHGGSCGLLEMAIFF